MLGETETERQLEEQAAVTDDRRTPTSANLRGLEDSAELCPLSNVDPDGGGGVEHTCICQLERNLLEASERATRLDSQMEFLTAQTAKLEGFVECERGHSSFLQFDLKRASNRNAQLQEAVSVLETRERESKTKYTLLWRINCEQLSEYDDVITVKEEEIVTLKTCNAVLERNQHSRPCSSPA